MSAIGARDDVDKSEALLLNDPIISLEVFPQIRPRRNCKLFKPGHLWRCHIVDLHQFHLVPGNGRAWKHFREPSQYVPSGKSEWNQLGLEADFVGNGSEQFFVGVDPPLVTQSRHSGDFPQDTNHVVLERAGALDSDRWGSTSFSVAEGAIGGDASAPVTAKICCWHESPSAMIRSNAPPAQS